MDVDAERILFQPVGVRRRLHDDREDGAPALGRGERIVDVSALGPSDPEAVSGGANDARDFDGDLGLVDLGEGVARPGIVVQRQRTRSVT
jgi:hypothetical protein